VKDIDIHYLGSSRHT